MPRPGQSTGDERVGGTVVLAASHGGHLGQAMRLQRDIQVQSCIVTTQEGSQVVQRKDVLFIAAPLGVSGWLRNASQSLLLAARLRPALVVALGSGGVGFFCLWCRLLGARLVLVESFARVSSPSKFVQVLGWASSAVYVQWPSLAHKVPKAIPVQPIYRLQKPLQQPIHRVLVTVGTYREGMNRLIELVDKAMPLPGNPEVAFQIGHSSYVPRNGHWFRFAEAGLFERLIEDADIVITHDGSAVIAQALEHGRPLIVIPRTPDELDYRGRAELADELARLRWILIAHDASELQVAAQSISTLSPSVGFAGEPAATCVDREYRRISRKRPTRKGGSSGHA